MMPISKEYHHDRNRITSHTSRRPSTISRVPSGTLLLISSIYLGLNTTRSTFSVCTKNMPFLFCMHVVSQSRLRKPSLRAKPYLAVAFVDNLCSVFGEIAFDIVETESEGARRLSSSRDEAQVWRRKVAIVYQNKKHHRDAGRTQNASCVIAFQERLQFSHSVGSRHLGMRFDSRVVELMARKID